MYSNPGWYFVQDGNQNTYAFHVTDRGGYSALRRVAGSWGGGRPQFAGATTEHVKAVQGDAMVVAPDNWRRNKEGYGIRETDLWGDEETFRRQVVEKWGDRRASRRWDAERQRRRQHNRGGRTRPPGSGSQYRQAYPMGSVMHHAAAGGGVLGRLNPRGMDWNTQRQYGLGGATHGNIMGPRW